jgi:hypothetical protein
MQPLWTIENQMQSPWGKNRRLCLVFMLMVFPGLVMKRFEEYLFS